MISWARVVDFLTTVFFLSCIGLGLIWMVMFSIDMVHQLMRVCR